MKAHITHAVAVGQIDEHHWSHVVIGTGWYAVLEVMDPNGAARSTGMRIVAFLSERMKAPPTDAKEIAQVLHSIGFEDVIQSLMIAFPLGSTMHFLIRNTTPVYLKRKERFALLTRGPGTTSGVMQPGDIFLAVTDCCERSIGQNELLSIIDHLSASDISQQLAVRFASSVESVGMGALVLEVASISEETVDEREPVSVQDAQSIQTVIQKTDWVKKARRMIRPRTRLITLRRKFLTLSRRLRSLDGRITIGVTLLFLLSVGIGLAKSRSMQIDRTTQETVARAKGQYEEGIALTALNPIKARESLESAQKTLTPIVGKVSDKTKSGREIEQLSIAIQSALTQAKREYEGEPLEFYDPSLLKTGSRVTDIELYGDTIALLDPTQKSVYAVSVSTKNGQIIGGGEGFDGSSFVAIHGDTIFSLTSTGIHEISIRDKTTRKNIIKTDKDAWGKIKKMTAFFGNVYLLDSQKGRIWKYIKTDTGFSDRKEYLTADTTPDFTTATNLSIDGSVYVGFTDGSVKKYTQGREDVFSIRGVDPAIAGPVYVYASDANEKIYFLEPQAKRVVVVAKDGMYEAQYRWNGSLIPIGFAVSEKAGTILLLADGKLFSIQIQ